MLFQNICSDASMVQDCWNLTETRVRTKIFSLRPNAAYKIASVIHAVVEFS